MTYSFLNTEDIDEKSRTIVKEIVVPAVEETVKEETFTLEEKETSLVAAQKALVAAQAGVDVLEAEILEIKTVLKIA